MNNYLVKVKEFMTTFGQPVLDKPTPLPDDRQELRIALIWEELKEYSVASGKLEYFNLLAMKSIQDFQELYLDKDIEYVPIIDQVEQLDALEDMQYVLSGAVHEHGFGEIFDAGFDEVHDSNMSKADDNIEDAIKTQSNYGEQGLSTFLKKVGNKIITYRTEDNKVLKSYKYKPAQLAQFLKPQKSQIEVYLTFKGIDDWHRAVFKDKTSSSYYGDCNCNKTGLPKDVIEYYKNNIDKLEYFGEYFNCEPHGGLNSNIKLIIE